MFREFERYIKIMKSYKGVDWSVFVKTRNKERKNNESKKEYVDEKLFDEDDSDALKEVQRQEQLRQRYEEYFASDETELIEKELMMAADDSASDHSDKDEAEKLSPRSFEKAHSE